MHIWLLSQRMIAHKIGGLHNRWSEHILVPNQSLRFISIGISITLSRMSDIWIQSKWNMLQILWHSWVTFIYKGNDLSSQVDDCFGSPGLEPCGYGREMFGRAKFREICCINMTHKRTVYCVIGHFKTFLVKDNRINLRYNYNICRRNKWQNKVNIISQYEILTIMY